jgi:2-methylcitrate dehydratase PrpD
MARENHTPEDEYREFADAMVADTLASLASLADEPEEVIKDTHSRVIDVIGFDTTGMNDAEVDEQWPKLLSQKMHQMTARNDRMAAYYQALSERLENLN